MRLKIENKKHTRIIKYEKYHQPKNQGVRRNRKNPQ